ncbi:PstS family phosphate ABC transporter substrate-binding protein [Vulcanococcus limneticus Candia 3F8]|uniref:PstS family phosphate ABC transporter substrate-binding protein n=1 Tax=Vulcanococcus limneticus TaxID=2170428 RepID=UPI000B981A28|nr:PstS family phosphate ABC transporter substrate-binding protein [Vulcanococcus limneticus]MCP9792775.1 PstS family phosphate ABC transporter substrate-binding protein [Vulcanococcus limneticus MW73D5]MCP9894727.1 PstS family phosphate ABC transporter substrate-binding protein [Vulcanococcus limneticus Candia 3F8]MCP9898205.1 PstS family phosphate ABC transporter substrate-binding protein [Vulcanococcus limneticus Candia 3B3]
MRGRPLACLLVALVLSVRPGGAQTAGSKPASTVRINGSSTVLPLAREAVRSFEAGGQNRGRRFDLGASGTSAGFRQFCEGRLSIANASRPISSAELKQCKARGVRFLELPVAFDAITVVVHPSNHWLDQISTAQLSKLWSRQAEGTIRRWKQVDPAWPDRPIRLCGPGKDSGTFDTFNKAINGREEDSRRDYTASEDDDVLVRCVATNPNALGYFGFDYYQSNRKALKALAVVGPRGPVLPSEATVQQSLYIPLSRALFMYVNERDLQKAPVVRQFVNSILQQGTVLARRSGVIPLPDSTYRLVEAKLYRNIAGTAFGGTLPVGLSLGDILQRSFAEHKQPQFR